MPLRRPLVFPEQVTVSGIAGLQHRTVSEITAIIIPRVTCELPLRPVSHDLNWKHLSDLPLADPGFGEPGKIDVLLGADVFADVLLHGRRTGSPGTPTAFETICGWVLYST